MDDGAYYDVPANHVQSHTLAPHLFVRVKAPQRSFELVYDSRSAQRTAANGWPVIFSLNDRTAPHIEYVEVHGQKVVCRKASAPEGGCGFKLIHQGMKWSVLFPQEHLASIGDMQIEAVSQLQIYRRLSRGA
jgi:hypothetical protein